jgi:hypothetical protein
MSGLAGGLPEILPLSCRDKNLTFSGNAGVLKDVGFHIRYRVFKFKLPQ